MRMRPEDLTEAMNTRTPDNVECLHGTMIVAAPTPEGIMLALRVASHPDPRDRYKDDGYVPKDMILVRDYAMNQADLTHLARAVSVALDYCSSVEGSAN